MASLPMVRRLPCHSTTPKGTYRIGKRRAAVSCWFGYMNCVWTFAGRPLAIWGIFPIWPPTEVAAAPWAGCGCLPDPEYCMVPLSYLRLLGLTHTTLKSKESSGKVRLSPSIGT